MTSTPLAWVTCAAASCLAILLLRQLSNFRGTTLAAPCLWAILSATSLAFMSALEATSQTPTLGLDALRFAALATTFCPIMAVLGAKRPQDRGWQWIVLSLWVIVVWPAAQAILLPTGTQVELFIVWKLFLVGLVSLGPLNYLPTRFWLPASLVAAGQLILLDSYLWRWHLLPNELTLPIAVACFLVAAIVAKIPSKNRLKDIQRPENAEQPNHSATCSERDVPSVNLDTYQHQWQTFRNAYGAFWALRILARVNETAELRVWPIRLTWTGFVPHNTTIPPTAHQLAELAQTMSTLLRRFNA